MPRGTLLSVSLRVRRGTAKAVRVQELIRVLQVVNGVHGDGTLPRLVPVEWAQGLSDAGGMYVWEDPAILVDETEPAFDLALCHEVGHLLDHLAIGGPPPVGAGGFPYASERRVDVLQRWQQAVDESDATQRLRAMERTGVCAAVSTDGTPVTLQCSQTYVEYLLRPCEQWARSYAQWVAVTSGDARLMQQLRAVRRVPWGDIDYQEQWGTRDFAKIQDALDQLFQELGWRY